MVLGITPSTKFVYSLSRRYYRQLRTYHMGKVEQSEMVSSRNVAGMKLMTGCCDFSVDTDGYLDM